MTRAAISVSEFWIFSKKLQCKICNSLQRYPLVSRKMVQMTRVPMAMRT
jgi:hypothetical protein